jgi:protein-S-isoprenylcysteine O-methyltransferase Ste14
MAALGLGTAVFLLVVPLVFGLVGHIVSTRISAPNPPALRAALGVIACAAGLVILGWCEYLFWTLGHGTPNPAAAPRALVREGPYAHIRNPIQAAAMLYYFGLGTLFDSWVTGVVMLLLVACFWTLYHRVIEEKELRIRFGDTYEEYKRTTPFLIPRFGRRARI